MINSSMLTMLAQTLKAFIPPEEADKIKELITQENVDNCIKSIVHIHSMQAEILANQKLIMEALNVNSNRSDGNAIGIAAE